MSKGAGSSAPGPSPKKAGWFDEGECHKAQRAWRSSLATGTTSLEASTAEADEIILDLSTQRNDDYFKNSFRLLAARLIAGKLVQLDKQAELRLYIVAV